LPWEITTIYSEVLKQSGHQSDDEEDEDDIEAHEASILRLKEADDATRQMTREEYQHYSDCRQASFTYRKGLLGHKSVICTTNAPPSKALPRIPQPSPAP
jgi:transcription initiation protein SPT3